MQFLFWRRCQSRMEIGTTLSVVSFKAGFGVAEALIYCHPLSGIVRRSSHSNRPVPMYVEKISPRV